MKTLDSEFVDLTGWFICDKGTVCTCSVQIVLSLSA